MYKKDKDWSLAKGLWQGGIFKSEHCLAIMGSTPNKAHICLQHFQDSAVLTWPCDVLRWPGGLVVLQPQKDIESPELMAVWELDTKQALAYEPISYASMYSSSAVLRATLKAGVYLRVTRGPCHPLEIACEKAWWQMSRTAIVRFGELHPNCSKVKGRSSIHECFF